MNKNKKNEFVQHLEDKEELLKERAKEKERQEELKSQIIKKTSEYNKYSTIVIGVVIFLFLIILGGWFMISRDKMRSMPKNFNTGAIDGFLHQLKEKGDILSAEENKPEIDWQVLVDELKEKEDLTVEEEELINNILDEAENTDDVKEALSNILKEE